MSKKETTKLVRQITSLRDDDLKTLRVVPDDRLPEILQELGISLPGSSWVLRVIKIVLYGLGIVLAGLGTAQAATMVI